MDVYLQQNITPETDMLVNTLAKIILINLLNGIPTKHDKVFWSLCLYCLVAFDIKTILANCVGTCVLQAVNYGTYYGLISYHTLCHIPYILRAKAATAFSAS